MLNSSKLSFIHIVWHFLTQEFVIPGSNQGYNVHYENLNVILQG